MTVRHLWNRTALVPGFILVLSLLSLILLGGEYLTFRQADRIRREAIDRDLKAGTDRINALISLTLRESMTGYLKGVTESRKETVAGLYNAAGPGGSDENRLRELTEHHIRSHRIGNIGYFAAVNSRGEIVAHPDTSQTGRNLAHLPEMQEILLNREGYIETVTEKDTGFLEKSLYYTAVQPLEWIVIAIADRRMLMEKINLDPIRDRIIETPALPYGSQFILNRGGDILLHPTLAGQNLHTLDDTGLYTGFLNDSQTGDRSGIIEFTHDSPAENRPVRKRYYYTWMSDTDWMIGSVVNLESAYAPLRQLTAVSLLSTLLPLLLFLPLLLYMILRVSRPETSLSDRFFRHSSEGITVTDSDGCILRINRGFTRITGYPEQDVLGRKTRILKSEVHRKSFYRQMWKDLKSTGYWSGEIWNRRKNGEVYLERLTISGFRDSVSGNRRYIAQFYDLTNLREKEQEISRLTFFDPLTGLPNRRRFLALLEERITTPDNRKKRYMILILNPARLRSVNVQYGYGRGNELLKVLSRRLLRNCPSGGMAARLEGDRFSLFLPVESREAGREWSRSLLSRLSRPFGNEENSLTPLVSAGASFYPDDGLTSELLLARAAIAQERRNSLTGGQIGIYSDQLDLPGHYRQKWELDLRQALKKEELYLLYQPKLSLSGSRITGFEALLRWNRNRNEQISPSDFIPLAEESGLIIPLGRWVLDRAALFIRRVADQGYEDIHVAVNISAAQFLDEGFITMLRETTRRHGISPARLELEITENIAAGEVHNFVEITRQLTELGHPVSLDDFGTGYSSLQYLKDFPFSTIKIDKSFVDRMLEDSGTRTIIQSILTMSRSMNKKTVAEGVETEDQKAFLNLLGCDDIQGYLISPPVSEQESEELLKRYNQTNRTVPT